jgi:hypothetical protein
MRGEKLYIKTDLILSRLYSEHKTLSIDEKKNL